MQIKIKYGNFPVTRKDMYTLQQNRVDLLMINLQTLCQIWHNYFVQNYYAYYFLSDPR